MILQIPTFDSPFYTQVIDLDGVDYLFDFRYNQRENAWYFSIALVDETPLVSGIKIVVNVGLLQRFPSPLLPPGLLIALSNTTDQSPPGIGELGTTSRVTLLYFDKAELLS